MDIAALIEAIRNKLQVTLTYTKDRTGEIVTHTGGIYEIGPNSRGSDVIWLWDTTLNDHIRQFLLSNIQNYQVLDAPFIPPGPYDIKIYGEVIL